MSAARLYGLYDTVDRCWIGDLKGPRLFSRKDYALGKVAEAVANEAMGYARVGIDVAYRIHLRRFRGGRLVFKDEQALQVSPTEALERIEGRA